MHRVRLQPNFRSIARYTRENYAKKNPHPSREGFKPHALTQKREFVPFVAAGVAVVVGMTAMKYFARAAARMKEEQELGNIESELEKDDMAVLGLDLGSTYSKISYWKHGGDDGKESEVSVLENKEGRRAVASAIMWETTEAEPKVGHLARAARFHKPDSVVYAPILLFGAKYATDTQRSKVLGALPFDTAAHEEGQEVSVALGKESTMMRARSLIRTLAEDIHRTAVEKVGGDVPVVLSVPNFYPPEAHDALLEALRGSGLTAVGVLPDSVCSIIGAFKTGKMKARDLAVAGGAITAVVVDIGGRLTQLSLMHIEGTDKNDLGVQVTSLSERTLFEVGGDFVDDAIVSHIAEEFERDHGVDLLADGQAKQRLYDAAETLKQDLTKTKMASVNVPFVTATTKGPLHLDKHVTKAALDSMMEKQTAALKEGLTALLFEDSKVAKAPLTTILLAGAGSRMSFVKSLAKDVSGGVDTVTVREPESLAAIGAAAAVLHFEK